MKDALRAADRAARFVPRRGVWRRRLAMVLPGALVPSLLIVVGYLAIHQAEVPPAPTVILPAPASPAPTPRSTPAAMPRVIYGNADPDAQDDAGPSGTFTIRAAVVDGDTLATGSDRLRINGIDAPEVGQACEQGGRTYDCGAAARAAMMRILGQGDLTCETIGIDQYRRRVVRCDDANGQDIAAALVAQGWAMAYRQFSVDYVPQEEQARAYGRGIWAGRFEAPWDWRRRQRQ